VEVFLYQRKDHQVFQKRNHLDGPTPKNIFYKQTTAAIMKIIGSIAKDSNGYVYHGKMKNEKHFGL
jgi:hypothetical protein